MLVETKKNKDGTYRLIVLDNQWVLEGLDFMEADYFWRVISAVFAAGEDAAKKEIKRILGLGR